MAKEKLFSFEHLIMALFIVLPILIIVMISFDVIRLENPINEYILIAVMFLVVFVTGAIALITHGVKRTTKKVDDYYHSIRESSSITEERETDGLDVAAILTPNRVNLVTEKDENGIPIPKVDFSHLIKELEKPKPKTKVYDALQIMFVNMRELKEYYEISQMQASNSFALAVILSTIGVMAFIVSISTILFFKMDLATAIVPVIGSAITEIIAGTALLIYKSSLKQLNLYYDALHSNELFLSHINLVSKLSLANQEIMYMEIVRSFLKEKKPEKPEETEATEVTEEEEATEETEKPKKPKKK